MSPFAFIPFAFLSTELLECITILLLQKKGKFAVYCLIANITNPIVNLVLMLVSFSESIALYYSAMVILEILAVIYEAVIYKHMGDLTTGRSFAVSAICNSVSLFIGSGSILIIKLLIP